MNDTPKANSAFAEKHYFWIGLLACLLAVNSSTFLYDQFNSGRYIPTTAKIADNELFPNDPYVDGMAKFSSIFYTGIGWVMDVLNISVNNLYGIFYVLYGFSRVLLFSLLMLLAWRLDKDWRFFLLLAALFIHSKMSPVGGESLFVANVTHTTYALILGIGALWAALEKKFLWFWVALAAAAQVHFLVAAHVAACLAIPAFFRNERSPIKNGFGLGLAIFLASSALYVFVLSPGSMSGGAADFFLAVKGDSAHVSPFAQDRLNWITMLFMIAVAWMGSVVFLKENDRARFLLLSIITGVLVGSALADLAVVTQIPQLTLLQPMRIFVIVTFLCYVLLAWAAAKGLAERKAAGVLIAGFLIAMMINASVQALALLGFAVLVFGATAFVRRFMKTKAERAEQRIDRAASIVLALFALALLLPPLFRDRISSESLTNPWNFVLPLALFILLLTNARPQKQRDFALAGSVALALLVGMVYQNAFYGARLDPNWDDVREWCRDNTPKNAAFVTTVMPDSKNIANFRAVALRTSVNEVSSALAWVDPMLYNALEPRASEVAKAYSDEKWSFDVLTAFAATYNADYILVHGECSGSATPVYSAGDFHVFRLADIVAK